MLSQFVSTLQLWGRKKRHRLISNPYAPFAEGKGQEIVLFATYSVGESVHNTCVKSPLRPLQYVLTRTSVLELAS